MVLPRARLSFVLVSFLQFSMTARLFVAGSLLERAIIREVNETVFAVNFLETGDIVGEKWEYSMILSTDLASLALRRLPFVFSDFRPPSVTEPGEAALRRRGDHSLTSGDPAPGSLSVFQSHRVARPQCLRTSLLLC